MAYKFQFGTTKLSGSTTFEESLVGESTISGSGRISGKELILDNVGVIGTADDTDLLTLSADTVNVAGDLSSSLDLKGRKLTIMQNGNIGVAGDTDLMALAPNALTLNGAATVEGALSASGQVDLPGAVRFGTENQLTVSVVGVLSGSATATLANATLDQITVGSADINGGAIDNATIGASTQSSGKFTTLSASSTADFAGQARFGTENQTTVSAVGLLSSSATATLANATLDRITVGDADINGGNIDGAVIGGTIEAAGTFTTLSASSTLQAMGVVTAGNGKTSISAEGVISSSATATIANATFDRITAPTLLGDMSGSGGLTLGGALDVGNSRLVVNENLVLMTGPIHVSGNAFVDEDLTTAKLSTDSVLYFDAGSGELRRDQFSNYASVLAGTGITATDGVLSVDTTGGDSMTSTVINYVAASNDGFTLTAGLNWFAQDASGSTTLTLPSGAAGDVVIVKAGAGVSSTNFIKITSSLARANQIDGFSEARIESPHGAVSLIYSDTGYGQWVIY